jgi:hypothetical protein
MEYLLTLQSNSIGRNRPAGRTGGVINASRGQEIRYADVQRHHLGNNQNETLEQGLVSLIHQKEHFATMRLYYCSVLAAYLPRVAEGFL